MNVVLVGASWGGVKAVGDVLSSLPSDFAAAVLVAQHRPADLPGFLPKTLGQRTALRVKEAEDREPICKGTVYLAPANRHLLLDPDGILRLSGSAKVNFACPAADVLFESAAANHKSRLVAVVLTGKGGDGGAGMEAIKGVGGYVIAQDPATAEASSMPVTALLTGAVDETLPLMDIGPALVRLVAESQPTREQFA